MIRVAEAILDAVKGSSVTPAREERNAVRERGGLSAVHAGKLAERSAAHAGARDNCDYISSGRATTPSSSCSCRHGYEPRAAHQIGPGHQGAGPDGLARPVHPGSR